MLANRFGIVQSLRVEVERLGGGTTHLPLWHCGRAAAERAVRELRLEMEPAAMPQRETARTHLLTVRKKKHDSGCCVMCGDFLFGVDDALPTKPQTVFLFLGKLYESSVFVLSSNMT